MMMKKWIVFLFAMQLALVSSFGQLIAGSLLTEHMVNPIGIDIAKPCLSWQLQAERRGTMQAAYEIRVGSNPQSLRKAKDIYWSSAKINSASSAHVPYGGAPLGAGKKYFWQVRVWDDAGKVSAWSEPAYWQMGMLQVTDWKASWISAGFEEDSIQRPSPLFRKSFTAAKTIKSATIYITAHGMYEGYINGKRIGDAFLTPGWTSYNNRLQYQTYDVTGLLAAGKNAIGITLGSGWYRGFLAWGGNHNSYGTELALLCQLDIEYTDGTREWVVSDKSWKSATGPVKSSEIYHGETYDARDEKTGWTTPSYDDAAWSTVLEKNEPKNILVASSSEPVRKHETFAARRIFTTPKGEKVVDFGQNLVGWVQLSVKGRAGDRITIHHAEVLDKEGNFYTDNLRSAKETNVYTLKGGAEEILEPHFTFQGFRYIKIEGFPGDLQPENLKAITLYSDMKPTGDFTCSNPLLNQLQHNIQWGQRGNFLDVPTDCPQRDERLGWTGDAQVFSRTATFNFRVNNFFAKWMKDLAADQFKDGSVPFVVPNILGPKAGGSTGWADASTIIPYNVYLAYGDKRILEQQYNSMKSWVGYMESQSKDNLWDSGFHFGDWLFYRPDDDNDGRSAITDKYLIAQCFYAHSVQLMINTAKILDKKDDVERYTGLLQKLKGAFLKEYLTPNGRLVSGSQTAYVLALHFDMLPENLRAQAAARLVENIKDYDTHLTTGFLGTPYICGVLTRFGYLDIAYKLLLQDTYPSWLYPVTMGATTIWERWDGEKPDSSFQTPGMNSFNHYAYGAIGDWMYRVIAGLDTYDDEPGYKHIKIQPMIGGGLTEASASLQTYYGILRSGWKKVNNRLELNIEIPPNTRADIFIPAASAASVKEGEQLLAQSSAVKIIGDEKDAVHVTLGSGKYHFVITE